MKGSYQVVIAVMDVEDALEVAELLAPLKTITNIKVASIGARPEPRPVPPQPPVSAQQKMVERTKGQ